MPEQQPVSEQPDAVVQAARDAMRREHGWAYPTHVATVLDAAAHLIRAEARAQVIRELREVASVEGPQSAYWLAADYLERREAA